MEVEIDFDTMDERLHNRRLLNVINHNSGAYKGFHGPELQLCENTWATGPGIEPSLQYDLSRIPTKFMFRYRTHMLVVIEQKEGGTGFGSGGDGVGRNWG